jgi:hypothetical protein
MQTRREAKAPGAASFLRIPRLPDILLETRLSVAELEVTSAWQISVPSPKIKHPAAANSNRF